jgi:small subunit ribosomal protein S17
MKKTNKKERIGIVVSDKPQKTIIVAIQIRYQHPKYTKTLVKTKRYMAHDENNECKAGDLVLIEESSPLSKYKRWILKEILKVQTKKE